MRYFSISTIKTAIEGLQSVTANWLLPAFVFAANDVGTDGLVDISKKLGTDQFLDRYFNGKRVGIPPFPTGNNLLRPRLGGLHWDRGLYADDYMIRQNTKMWGNLFSSRGYREMRLQGLIEGEKTVTGLTDAFQARFEQEIPSNFQFEDFLVWLFAFEGVPDDVQGWPDLMAYLLNHELHIDQFKPQYTGRFKLSDPGLPWPVLQSDRPSNEQFVEELAPKLAKALASGQQVAEDSPSDEEFLPDLSPDDPIFATVTAAIQARESLAFLLAGPPGTGKTRYARQLATAIAEKDSTRILFLQFHPAIGYDDFVEGFRPTQSKEKGGTGVRYELKPRLFLDFANRASKDLDKKYVAVIDELNRGDVARIFGEVLTYLEVDYRGVEFTLSFSGDPASLPKNLIVIATANPFDRSVTDLDDALLRRFWVIELDPDGALLKNHLQENNVEEGVVNRTLQVFNILNEALPSGFGHTSFLRVRNIDDLAAIWTGRIRLALRRAFMHDRPKYDSTVAEIEGLLVMADAPNATDTGAG